MSALKETIQGGSHFFRRRFAALWAIVLSVMAPSLALASGGENVVLRFSNSDKMYLYASLGIGLIAILFAFFIRAKILAMPRGDEKMQEVGDAVREGAVGYLRQQVKMMGIFVIVLAVGLFLMYRASFGPATAGFIALAFVLGVAASYIAGTVGMMMAVNANTRTANAALTSYKSALETAFRAGAVAGLVTVGMGLIGATGIFLAFGADAMKVLVGFGFGGSLAALFMRVGGGIYTKAADVGADLVGKVEAGIPEDDPRNPATIADNVGDNVGDCAGMAADVFESYEVTLVAAIILGAATATLFDSSTWMKLILFALMARGVGIVASIIGILSVKGDDDVDKDPLKMIKRGFYSSAFIAALGTAVLAYFMMGGIGKPIQTTRLISQAEANRSEIAAVQAIAKPIAAAKYKGKLRDVKPEDLQKDPAIIALGLDKPDLAGSLAQYVTTKLEDIPEAKRLLGFTAIDTTDDSNPVLNYAMPKPSESMAASQPELVTLKEVVEKQRQSNGLQVLQISITQSAPAARGATPQTQTRDLFYGPVSAKLALNQINEAKKQGGTKIEIKGRYSVDFLSNGKGEVAVGIGAPIDESGAVIAGAPFSTPHKLQGSAPMYVIKEGVAEAKKAADAQRTMGASMPETFPVQVASIRHTDVEWWKFLLCIFFGIAMAFAFEMLTDYYVSTHNKPVQEVALVSSAGPAPMIIQGMALGLESSVFSLLAIVIALITPLFIFNPLLYDGYLLSFYGIALVGLGLLTTTGFILAMDTFGPISDNAQGVFEMSGCGHGNENATKGIQRLDAAGNTTKALTKGFAIATAVVAAVALFHSYVEGAQLAGVGMRIEVPEIFLGFLIGGAAPYLFCAFTINAVGRAAFQLINEVRRQFREDSGIMAGTSKPDYQRCVEIVTRAAQRELLGPGILAIFLPIAVAFGFAIGKPTTTIGGMEYNLTGAQALGGFLAGTILSGQLLAVMLANAGGIWDNAKKLIEDGMMGGKGTEAHTAAVVCDTVGDPFKDTAGPALNPLIKVMNLVALLMAPFVIMPLANTTLVAITVGSVILLAIAFYMSKRGSIATEMQAIANETEGTA